MRTRAGPVDFIRHQELAEYRSLDKAERTFTVIGLFQNLGTEDIRRHQVRRKLHPPFGQPQNRTQGFHQPGLGQAGYADQQDVPPGQQRDKSFFDDPLLTEYYPADIVADIGEFVADIFKLIENFRFFRIICNIGGVGHDLNSLRSLRSSLSTSIVGG